MNKKKLVIRAGLGLILIPFALVSLVYGFYFSVFYFPNWGSAKKGTIFSSGEKRDYLLYVPTSYNPAKPTPLVISMHTSMSWPSSSMAITQWNKVAEQNGFLVAYPGGTGGSSKSWEMEGQESPSRMRDVIFVSQLLNQLELAYNIDKARIYANGMSNGGGMAFVLSCTMSDRIAAVGMVSAGLDPGWNWCTDHKAVPVIAFHGSADPICPYNGGYSKLGGGPFPNVPWFMEQWSKRNQCGAGPVESAFNSDVTRRQYSSCTDGADVVLYTVKGEGHQWPGGRRVRAEWLVGPYSSSIDATAQMWAFFREHPLRGK